MSKASKQMQLYFKSLKEESYELYKLARKAKETGIDPEPFVEIKLAENLAERVVGLISAIAPQIEGSGTIERIIELEETYTSLDWRVALQIALEVSQEKFCKFEDKKEAMEVGIRVGLAYVTLGVVSAPLEGFTDLEIKKRNDNGEYFCINYAGPVRAAGGTAAAVSVLIADYVRKYNGYQPYDPTEKEIQRCHAELEDYHEYIANLQYFPSKEECEFLMKNLPVEISGDGSEKYEVSSALLKDLPRIETNKLRSGYCLIHSSCIPLKGPKLWKQLKKWGEEFGMEHWNFLEDFIKIQEKAKSKGIKKEKEDAKIQPDYTYVKDLVGGRPVIGHPLENGAFRLRYGRARNSGFSSQAIHPATMELLNQFIAIGTQLKVERPGKAAAYSSCDTIEGPIVKMHNGDVLKVEKPEDIKKYKPKIKEILYVGDVLVNYGDFLDRNHKLIPAGYCQERWIQEVKKKFTDKDKDFTAENLTRVTGIPSEKTKEIIEKPIVTEISFEEAKTIAERTKTPIHPNYTYFWGSIEKEDVVKLIKWLRTAKLEEELLVLESHDEKRTLELLGVNHKVRENRIIIDKDDSAALRYILSLEQDKEIKGENILDIINNLSPVPVKDKAGTFIGSRMGRPEKAKMRKLTGSPHGLFPVGEQGGRLRSIQSALEKGFIETEIQMYKCKCGNKTPMRKCEKCGEKTKVLKHCDTCGESTECGHEEAKLYETENIKIKELVNDTKKILGTNIIPDLIKGVRGTWNPEKISEHLGKGILRAKHNISVNKDGTVRYDTSEMALTHFTPKEISAPVEKLKKLGYEKDIYGEPLEKEDQLLELKPQDVVLPCSKDSPEEESGEVFYNTAKFIDESLKQIYGLKPFYNLKKKEDLIGHLAIGLAPHTSAGIATRIIGFSNTQAFFAHPYVHAAMRRDCDGDEACLLLMLDGFLNFSNKYLPSSRGSTMDAPLVLTSRIMPSEVDDMIFNMETTSYYPLELYEAADKYKMPNEVKMPIIEDVLGEEDQYENIGFSHNTSDINNGVSCSAYKLLPSMGEKVDHQMDLAAKIRAVDQRDVAKLVIEKHFIRDTKGNLKKFSLQQFRCVNCNEKYRRPPLQGKCVNCGGKIIFTISEGSVIKYMEHSLALAEKYDIDEYTRQVLNLTQLRIEQVFGKEKEKQTGLGAWS